MMRARILLAAIIAALILVSVGCGGPSGCSTAIPGQGGGTSGGSAGGSSPPPSSCILQSTGGTTAAGVYVLIADAGGIQGEFADTTNKKMTITPDFGTVSVDTNDPGDWMVIAQQQFMYTAYTDTGKIWSWSVSSKGLLTSLNPPSIAASYLTNTPVVGTNLGGASAGWQGMITNPAGTLLFVLDQTPGSEAIRVYQIGTAGLLTGPTTTLLPAGFGTPYNLAIDGQGKYLYVSNIVGVQTNEIMAYSFDGTGTLTPVPNSPFPAVIQQMQGEATGKYMIGTDGGLLFNHALYVAAIQSDGELTVTPTTVLGVPIEVTVQPNTGGNIVYAIGFPSGSSSSGPIEGFTFDASSGTLTEMANSPFSTVLGAHGEFDPSGEFFFFSTSTNASAVALYVYDTKAFPDLSSQLASTGWASGAWAPVDAQ
ncbi:MAG TPA: hypothetical protein VMS18_18400 [Candidatus Binatia bacterium]|nr:hypothetical protein [Candidatus Binatia bacterium]